MKKWLALLTALVLVLSMGSAMAAVEVEDLRKVVDSALKGNDLAYEYDSENEWFELGFDLESDLNTSDATIYLYDDMVSVSADTPIEVPSEQMEDMAILLTLINNSIYYAQFRLDMENGYLTCRSCNVIETVLPGAEEVLTLLFMPLTYMEQYGNTILAVVNEDADPYTAFYEISQGE